MSDIMETKEIICDLRDQADVFGPSTVYHLLHIAADRLEEQEKEMRKLREGGARHGEQ